MENEHWRKLPGPVVRDAAAGGASGGQATPVGPLLVFDGACSVADGRESTPMAVEA